MLQSNPPRALSGNKKPKKKSMSSEKASKVKLDGHENEGGLSSTLGNNASVIPGQGKTDVKYFDKNLSAKKKCIRIQFSLYAIDSKYWTESDISEYCKDCCKIFPENFDDYLNNKDKFKEELKIPISKLYEVLKKKENLKEYLKHIILNVDEIDYITMLNDNNIHEIYDSNEFIDILIDNIIVETSKCRKKGDTEKNKVLFKINVQKNTKKGIKMNSVNLIENEIRCSSKGHYKEWLCVCNRNRLLKLLNDKINEKEITHDGKIMLMGKSITNFKNISNN